MTGALGQMFVVTIGSRGYDPDNEKHFFTDDDLDAIQRRINEAIKGAVKDIYKEKRLTLVDVSSEYEADFVEEE